MKAKKWPVAGMDIDEKSVDGVLIKVFASRPHSLHTLLQETVSAYPEKEALVCGDERLTYQEFGRRVDRVSSTLQGICGLEKGDRAALLFTNTLEFCICYFAVTQIGAICQPLNYRLSEKEMLYQLTDTGAKVLILEDAYRKLIQSILPELKDLEHVFVTGGEVPQGFSAYDELENTASHGFEAVSIDEEDIASIMYTSGTTGRPKGAMLSHRNLICNAISFACIAEVGPDTKQIILTPLFHASALHSQLITSVLKGGNCVIMKEFKTRESLDLMAEEKVNLVVAVPTMYWFWVNEPDLQKYDLSSVEYTISGAAPAAPELIKRLSIEFPSSKFINAGGQTESTSCTFALPPADALRKAGSIGWATPPNDIIVVTPRGEECDYNESGELWFKGPAIARGYWNNPEGTQETFTDGWVHTGDLGKVDEEGYLYLLDRKKDMIIRGGENIYCIEVENALYAHPKVLEAAVVGVPDKIFGEQVKAVLVLKPGETATEDEIREFCMNEVADYKVPKYLEFREMLPRNPGGKVVKSLLRKAT
jgi:acyl-CoA synthetase (AMP-forming)/AMP-acid ligase II